MTGKALESVRTKGVGFAPILRHFFDKAGIAEIIDDNVPLDPRRKILTHGEAAVAMITGILFQVSQLYKICQFADETTVLEVILPGIPADQYFDDNLGDTLDAIFRHGIGDLELLVTKNMIGQFDIESPVCHNDTTSVSVFGNYGGNQAGNNIKITFGHSKKHREDPEQFVWSLSVSSDSGFPLFQKACSGNTADVETYVEQWHNLIDLPGHKDFPDVADSKLATHENMAHIHDNEGLFIAPLPICESYKKVFHDALAEHGREILIPYKGRFNRGFEVPVSFEHEEETYTFRMIILFDHGVAARKRHTLENRIYQRIFILWYSGMTRNSPARHSGILKMRMHFSISGIHVATKIVPQVEKRGIARNRHEVGKIMPHQVMHPHGLGKVGERYVNMQRGNRTAFHTGE